MKKHWLSLGLSLVGLVLGVLLLLILPLPRLQAWLFSPGNGVHGGKVTCVECHTPFRARANCSNIACHPGLPSAYKSAADFHFHRQVSESQSCTVCHSEHTGPIDGYSSRGFDHDLFPVAQSRQCQKCHEAPGDSLHAGIAKGPSCLSCHSTTSWQGAHFSHASLLPRQRNQCLSCHAIPGDSYHALYTEQCSECHKVTAWKPAVFSHHALSARGRISCGVCHTAPGGEEHAQASLNCSTCHTTAGWGGD